MATSVNQQVPIKVSDFFNNMVKFKWIWHNIVLNTTNLFRPFYTYTYNIFTKKPSSYFSSIWACTLEIPLSYIIDFVFQATIVDIPCFKEMHMYLTYV